MDGTRDEHDRWERAKELFHGALERPAGERGAFLDGACGGDAELRAEVASLLDAHAAEARLLADPTVDGGLLAEHEGGSIGPYKLLQQIGEGGFGVVFMAEQREPVRRRVALKLIKLGMDTKQVIARFEAERQALALMDHPNIARVLDAGATDTGRPYFVMELVKGVPITEYCDANQVPTRARLELFVDVCRAVQHAHQKGIIHRDIKPSNVLVTLHDGVPVPKVIDFGVAKATNQELTAKTVFTEFRQFIGTPEYMSPEQAEMSGLDIDTRADVYALGVLLYELLTGTTPLDPKTLRASAYDEILRIIREVEPPKPSTRVQTLGATLADVARRRHAEPDGLGRLLRGDLDWIVMRALEKDRTRRYETADALAADVRRHLADEPVLAGPPSLAYRARKFVRRNRAAVVSGALIVLALVAGSGLALWGMLRADRERDDAIAARDEVAVQRQAALDAQEAEQRLRQWLELEVTQADQTLDFLLDLLSLADVQVAMDPDLSVRTLLDRAAARVDGTFDVVPVARAKVLSHLGRAYLSMGLPADAEPHLLRAVQLHAALSEPGIGEPPGELDPYEVYDTLWGMTYVAFELERDDAYAFADRARRHAHGMLREASPALADAADAFIEAVNAMDFERAEPAFDEMVRLANAALDVGDPLWRIYADTPVAAGLTLWHAPQERFAVRYYQEALRVQRRALPPQHPDTAQTMSYLVGTLNRVGQHAEAAREAQRALTMLREVLPEGHWQIAFAESQLGECLANEGRFEEAEEVLLRACRTLSGLQDERQFHRIDAHTRLISMYDAWGRPQAAAPHRRELVEWLAAAGYPAGWSITRHVFGPEHASVVEPLTRLQALVDPYDPVTPEPAVAAAVAAVIGVAERDLADPNLRLLVGRLYGWWAAMAPALPPTARRALAEETERLLRPHAERLTNEYARTLATLADCDLAAGDAARAEARARDAWGRLAQQFGAGHWIPALCRARLARALEAQGRHDEAAPHASAAATVLEAQRRAPLDRTVSALFWLPELEAEPPTAAAALSDSEELPER